MSQVNPVHSKVIIIGSGVSGLAAAHTLMNKYGLSNRDVLILEAADYCGGRIKQDSNFIPGIEIELGAELCHGDASLLSELSTKLNEPLIPLFIWAHGDGGPLDKPVNGLFGMYYLAKEKKVLRYDSRDADFRRLNYLIKHLGEYATANKDKIHNDHRSFTQYLKDSGVTDRMLGLASAGYANTACSNMHELSFAKFASMEASWDTEGNSNDYRFANTFKVLIRHFSQNARIRYHARVRTIDTSDKDTIHLTTEGGERYSCQKLVCSAPISVLRDGDITFRPELPAWKTSAFQGMNTHPAMKVICKFNKRFWPKGLNGTISSDATIPEIWFRDLEGDSRLRDPSIAGYAVAFITADFAKRALAMPKDELIKSMVNQLDDMFEIIGDEVCALESEMVDRGINPRKPASSCFIAGMIYNWGDVESIRCGYGSPVAGFPLDCPERIALPIDNKIFFAGEHSMTGGTTTVQAAIHTGLRAADEIAQTLNLPAVTGSVKSKL